MAGEAELVDDEVAVELVGGGPVRWGGGGAKLGGRREGGSKGGREREECRDFWVVRSLLDFIYGWRWIGVNGWVVVG